MRSEGRRFVFRAGGAVVFALIAAGGVNAQHPPGEQRSSNVTVLSHVPLGGAAPLAGDTKGGVLGLGRRTSDIEMEQELSRPYVYVDHRFPPSGFDIVDIRDPLHAKVIWRWVVENAELHQGSGALDNKYFKLKGRYYDIQSFQFQQGGPDADLGAIVFDVTGLPNPATIKEVARIRAPDAIGGFHNIFAYKHSDGRVLLFATVNAPEAYIYDMEKLLAGAPNYGLIGKIPVPQGAMPERPMAGYHDFYVAYDAATHRDIFYGGGAGGYYVYDISDTGNPRILSSVTGVQGISFGHTFTPSPDGRYAVAETEYRNAPLRIFDLKPDGKDFAPHVSRSIGAWTANWKNYAHNHEVRWPYVFVASFDDGLQIFNMMDPTNPVTVGFYDTFDGPDGDHAHPETEYNGGWGVDVRNADGLIVLSDFTTGFWLVKMEGFDGWNGKDWGMPNVSSVQDWDNGPEGAKPAKPVT